jgi:hypothetical protein
LAGILAFNVTTLECSPLQAPINGRLVFCHQPAVYGSVCTFQCNAGYRLNDRTMTSAVCERRDDGSTYWSWSGSSSGTSQATVNVGPPRCVSVGVDVPTTTSPVQLRVGARLQMRCPGAVLSWSKDDRFLQDGFKYTIDGRTLTVSQTVASDAGIYTCTIHQNMTVIGRNKFNVTTLSCPYPVAPSGVSIERCPESPVYGDTCVYRCTDGRANIVAGNRVRSCEVKDFDTVYWSGEPPTCSDLRQSSSGQHSGSGSSSSSGSSNIPHHPSLIFVVTVTILLITASFYFAVCSSDIPLRQQQNER